MVTRKPTKEELAYWNQYHQSKDDLRANNIYSISKLYLNKKLFHLKDTDLRFGYFYDGYWKIYRPFGDKKNKWVPNNVPITAMDGKEDIKHCRMAFINKSKKDYMVMKKVFPCSCAVQNEGIACFSTENVDYLKANSDIQILSFDSDVTGVQNSQQITKLFNFEYANVPQKYLKEGMEVNILFWNDKVLEVELPNSVILEITDTDPGVKGDTATGGTKPAIVETGAQVMVPLFISIGERIKVDTRDGSYLGGE